MAEGVRHFWRNIPRSVWMLGLVALCMDISSELVHSLLPLFLVDVLAASTLTVGLIEGFAAASIVRVFSGVLSDLIGKRKLLTALGYGLSAATKPIFALADSAGAVLAARSFDRIGKGIVARRAMHLSRTSLRQRSTGPPSVCAKLSTQSGPLPDRCSRSG